jgi:hypothetical protein
MVHQNLSDEFDLCKVKKGDKLKIIIGKDIELNLLIIKPAKKSLNSANDSALAWLPGKQWSNKCQEKKVKVIIGGACTYNPNSPLGMTMLQIGHITKGRHLILWRAENDQSCIFKHTVTSWEYNKK